MDLDQLSLLAVSADTGLVALLESTVRLSVILLVAWAIAFALRRASAHLRHLVWGLALTGGLLLPMVASSLPRVSLPVPRWESALEPGAGTPIATHPSASSTRAGLDPRRLHPPTEARASAAAAANDATERELGEALAPAAGRPSGPRGLLASAPTWRSWWPAVVLGLWIAGVVALVLRIGVGVVMTRRLGLRAGPPSDPDWERLATEVSRRIGLTRRVRILSGGQRSMPMTWGWTRPVVLVPRVGDDWSVDRKRVVLLHELSHVKRYDCVSQLVGQVVCALYWFNPLVWLAARRLRVERERACDETVILQGTPASSYADHLLEIARAHRGPAWSFHTAVAMARRSQLEGRLLSILDAAGRPRPRGTTMLALGAVVTGVVVTLAVVTPTTPEAAGQTGTNRSAPATPEPGTDDAQDREPSSPSAPRSPTADEVAEVPAPGFAPIAPHSPAEADEEITAALRAAVAARRRQDLRRDIEAGARDLPLGLGSELRQRIEDLARLSSQVEVDRAMEIAQRASEIDLDRAVGGVRIAEQVRERLEVEIAEIQERVEDERQPPDPRVVELFLRSLSDPDAEVRERAARGLGRNRVEAAVGPLSTALGDQSPAVRERAAWALGRIRSPAAASALGAALDDPEPNVRAEAVAALGRIRDGAAVPPLVEALNDPEPRVRREATEALGRIRDAAAVDGLIGALGEPDAGVAEQAAEALGRIREPRAVTGLVGALGHPEPDVVEAAAESLGRIRSPEAIDGLIGALRGSPGEATEEIVEALGRIGGDQALDALVELTGDANPDVRRAVIEALAGRRWSRGSDGDAPRLRQPPPVPDPDPDPNPDPNPGRE